MEFNHKSVLLHEAVEGLAIKQDGIYVDGTMGGAGHSAEIVKRIGLKQPLYCPILKPALLYLLIIFIGLKIFSILFIQ